MTAPLRHTPTKANYGATIGESTYADAVEREVAPLWVRAAIWLNSVGGTANAITAVGDVTVVEYDKLNSYWFVPTLLTTGSATINIDGVGVRNIVAADGSVLKSGALIPDSLNLLVDDGTQLRLFSSSGGSGASNTAPDYYVQDKKTLNTDGGSFASGSWQTRTLNFEKRAALAGASLATNAITLQPGTYYIEWRAPAFITSGGRHKARLYNASDAVLVAEGSSEFCKGGTSYSEGAAIITITVAKQFQLQHISSVTENTDGFGVASNLGAAEIYSEVKVWKVGAIASEVVGIPGGAITRKYAFSTTTTDADPGNGVVRLNNATQNVATSAFIDLLDATLLDMTALYDSNFVASTNLVKGQLLFVRADDDSKWLMFNLTAVVTATGYRKLTLTPTQSSAASPFLDGDVLLIAFTRTADVGIPGGGIAIPYTFDTTTTDADPGNGKLRLGNATQNSATVIRADLLDNNGANWTTQLDLLDASTSTTKGSIRLTSANDPTKFLAFDLTARATPSGYRNLTVANTAYSSASPFANGDKIILSFSRSGDMALSAVLSVAGRTGNVVLAASDLTDGNSGTGNVAHVNAPTFIAPILGVAVGTSFNGLTITSTTGVFTIVNGKTLTVNKTLTLDGTDGTTQTFPSTTQTIVGRTSTDTLTNKTIDATSNTISNLATSMFAANVIDTDGTLAANSDTRVASQKALKTYADQILAAANAEIFKGVIDCSANPNYPAADAGWHYRVSVAGKIGGASGVNVEVGDGLLCITDGTSSGNQATVGTNWSISQANIDGAVTGPASATSANFPQFNGTTGKIISDSGKAVPSGAVVGTSDSQTLTNKTLTTPAISSPTGLVKADVGLGSVDNTSDVTKNAASVTLTNKTIDTASNTLKINGNMLTAGAGTSTATLFNSTDTIVGRATTDTLTNKTLTTPAISSPTGLVKADVGLGNVDNTSNSTERAATATLTNKTISGASNTLSAIALSSLASQNAGTFVMNNTGGSASPTAVAAAMATAALSVAVGDSGSGGTKGLVPGAGPGDAAAGKYYDAAGGYSIPAGTGGGSGLTDIQRQNFLLSMIYQAKGFGDYRRTYKQLHDGFMSSAGIGSGSGYAVTSTSQAVSYLAPTSTSTRITGATPAAPLGGTANNMNDNITGTTVITSGLGNLSAASAFSRIMGTLDLGSTKTITSLELKQAHANSSGSSGAWGFYTSPDNATLTAFGSDLGSTSTTPADYTRTGSVSARYVHIVAPATNWASEGFTFADFNAYETPFANVIAVSTFQTLSSAAANAQVLIEYDNSLTPTLNVDFTIEVTCDGGAHWDAASLSTVTLNSQAGRAVAETVDQATTSGTSFGYRYKTLTNKNIKLYGISETVH